MSNVPSVINEVRCAIEKMSGQFKAALPAHIPVDRFVRTVMTAIQTNEALVNADRRTLFSAATRAAQMGLLPDGREGAIVTFKNQCQFMPMLGGLLKLIRNSGELASLDAQVVCKNDQFSYRLGVDDVPQHEPDWFGERGEMIGAWAVARMKDGAAYVEVMSMKQINQVRGVSRSGSSGPWQAWPEEMARKTVIRRLAKRLPLSTDLDGALHEDDALFMPPEQHEEKQAQHDQPASNGKASRLAAVRAKVQPARAQEAIDMEAGEYQDMTEQDPQGGE